MLSVLCMLVIAVALLGCAGLIDGSPAMKRVARSTDDGSDSSLSSMSHFLPPAWLRAKKLDISHYLPPAWLRAKKLGQSSNDDLGGSDATLTGMSHFLPPQWLRAKKLGVPGMWAGVGRRSGGDNGNFNRLTRSGDIKKVEDINAIMENLRKDGWLSHWF